MKYSFFLLLILPVCISAQFQFSFSDSIKIISNNEPLSLPWAGGLNYPQFSSIDYDFDGDLDLLIFDRSGNQLRVFEHKIVAGEHFYVFDYSGAQWFPEDLRYRLFAIDYDGDGRRDLFAYGIGGIKVFRNTGDPTNGLSWEVVKEILYSDNWGTSLSLYVSSSDIPAIVDVDGDGDIDVLTFHIGGEYLRYHQNQSIDLYGHADSLEFVLKNECWGTFREDASTNSVYLNDNTTPCTTGNVPNPELPLTDANRKANIEKAHSGSTILALDIDGSGVMDLVLGDVAFPNLNLMINGGTDVNQNSAMVSTDPLFPSNSIPVSMNLFPATFNLDVNFDGVKDIIVAPNAKNISENEQGVHFYRNTGTNQVSNFVFETKEFLQGDMIDHGSGSIPILTDVDGDGLTDLIIGNFFAYKAVLDKESRIAFYKNTGSWSSPEFTLIDRDFQNLSALDVGLRMYPTFGDLNGDQKNDMILGLEDGTLSYFINNSDGNIPAYAPPIVNLEDANGTVIQNGLYAAPQLFDLNKDGLLDLIIGIKTGELIYYENTGSSSDPSFELVTDFLGGVDVAETSPNGYAAPCFFRKNDTTYAFIGAVDGLAYFAQGIDGNIGDGQIFDSFIQDYLGLNVGGYSSFAISNLDEDEELDLFVGQDLGGLFYLENDSNSSAGLISVEKGVFFSVWPNPMKNELTIELMDLSKEITAGLFTLTGERIETYLLNQKINIFSLDHIDSGVYFIRLSNCFGTTKLIKL
tara:strand:+ start:22 stop:2259 length:2238 start_codon:yes stop_codon:yes gene_type:complete